MLLSYMRRLNTARILLLDHTAINLYFLYQHINKLISGFHHALLQSIIFVSRLNALNYTKLRG